MSGSFRAGAGGLSSSRAAGRSPASHSVASLSLRTFCHKQMGQGNAKKMRLSESLQVINTSTIIFMLRLLPHLQSQPIFFANAIAAFLWLRVLVTGFHSLTITRRALSDLHGQSQEKHLANVWKSASHARRPCWTVSRTPARPRPTNASIAI